MGGITVCHVSRNLCPRMVKLAYVQQNAGLKTHWIGEVAPTFQKTIPFSTIAVADEIRFGGFQNVLRNIETHVDLFHVHTHLRDSHILEQIVSHAKKPFVVDCHDDTQMAESSWLTHRLGPTRHLAGENGVVYHSYCPADWFQPPWTPKHDFIIATGLSDKPGHFRYWLDVFTTMHKYANKVVCYTPSLITDEYAKIADMHGPIDIQDLIIEMAQSCFGLCGSPHPDANMINADPNKLYEYIAAAIPVICLGKKHDMVQTINRNRIGVAIDSIEEIADAVRYIHTSGIHENVIKVRDRFTMESQEPLVREFYNSVLRHG